MMLEGCKSVWLITRHPAARAWIERQGVAVSHLLSHLDEAAFERIGSGACVIGNLPLSWVARLNEKGVRYFNLDLAMPPHLRGRELDLDTFLACQPALTEYRVERVENDE